MSYKVAVASLDGRAHYDIINMLKEIEIPFYDLVIGETVDPNFKLVLTTRKERPLINHDRILCLEDLGKDPYIAKEKLFTYLYNEAENSLIIGIDPGKITGMAVYYRHKILITRSFYSLEEVVRTVIHIIRNTMAEKRIVRIGNGDPKLAIEIAMKILRNIKKITQIELVDERGTSSFFHRKFDKKVSRDQKSAIVIASRQGSILGQLNSTSSN
jgi:hypothetical protein